MSTINQGKQNAKLVEDLANYLVDNPIKSKKLPNDATYVVFTEKNTTLNKANQKLLESLKSGEKPVVKAKRTSKTNTPWEFTMVSA